MRKKQTFLLTVMNPENGSTALCGQVKVIASGKTCTFTSLDDLNRLLVREMNEEAETVRTRLDLTLSEEAAV